VIYAACSFSNGLALYEPRDQLLYVEHEQ